MEGVLCGDYGGCGMNESTHNGNPLNSTKILELIGTLIRRPRRGETRKGGKRRGLPLMCLVWQQSAAPRHAAPPTIDDRYGLLQAVELYLRKSTPSEIPSSFITLSYTETMERPPERRPLAERKDVDA